MLKFSKEIKNYIKKKNIERIFVLSGKKSLNKSGGQILLKKILYEKKYDLFYKKSNIPTFTELKIILKKIKKYKPDLIIAIGGGTILDYAKIASCVSNNKDLKNQIIKSTYPFKEKNVKLIAIPTTAGSGAEVTSNAVIYVNNSKYSMESKLLIPDRYYLFPSLLMKTPFHIKASAGFDAIAQALESLISIKSNSNSVKFANKSLAISLKNFIPYLKNPTKKNAKYMSLASNLAGKAINISKTTAPHAISYPFTALLGISHGQAVSLFFENFLKFNFYNLSRSKTKFNLKKRFNLIFKILKVTTIDDLEDKILLFKKEANFLKKNINTSNFIKKNYKKILKGVNLQRLKNNPVEIKLHDIKQIINGKI
jgi:alcohol dehydrogenase class IV